jgi:radical SAM protein with 4Fe4S-binding SPASM domain
MPLQKQVKKHAAFLTPVCDRWLFYAPLHKIAAVVNASAAAQLRNGRSDGAGGGVADLLELVRQAPATVPRPLEGDVCPSFLGIMPTRGCNLACVYCNFGGPTAEKVHMRPEIAAAAVDWMAERLVQAERRDFQIHFFGGEPFISPEIVDIVVHRSRYQAARHDLNLYIDASTNGVFSDSRREFIGDYFGGVVLSFDGPARFHDRHRPAFQGKPSFEVVSRTAKLLSEMPLDLCLRVCITDDSVGEMEDITRWMIESYKPAVMNFETLTPGVLAERAGLKVPDPYRFAVHCVGAYRVAEQMGVRAVYSAAEVEKARLSFCPVGTDALIVSPDGRASACYLMAEDWQARSLDMDVGWVHADGRVVIDSAALERARRLPLAKPRCSSCFAQWTCAGGCHVNQTYPGCTDQYTDFCIQTRLVTACVLLRDLGCDDLVDQLLSDRRAMETLALHGFDPVDVGFDPAAYGAVDTLLPSVPERGAARARSLVAEGLTLLA